MEKYGKVFRNSGVVGFEAGHNYIKVKFADDSEYLYTDKCTGAHNIINMKKLARRGEGLNTYIAAYVGGKFSQTVH